MGSREHGKSSKLERTSNSELYGMECSKIRKEKWDGKAKPREFKPGEQVMMRKSGMNTKLSETWLGPYTVIKANSPLSYKIYTGEGKLIQYTYNC